MGFLRVHILVSFFFAGPGQRGLGSACVGRCTVAAPIHRITLATRVWVFKMLSSNGLKLSYVFFTFMVFENVVINSE
jgi:hypothetical protein